MAKTSSSAQSALDAIADAADAAKAVQKAARSLPDKTVRKVKELAKDARGLADLDKKTIRKNPRKFAKKADRVVVELVRVTNGAIEKAERKATLRAEADRIAIEAARAAADAASRAEEAKALRKQAVIAEKAAERAERESDAAQERLADLVTAEEQAAPAAAAPGLSDLTVAELRSRARSTGYTGYSRLAKARLIALLS